MNNINCFIGMRTGIYDLVISSNARLFNISQPNFWDCDLKLIYPESNSKTFYSIIPVFNDIRAMMDQYNMDSLNISNLHFKHVNNEDVFPSEEMLIDAIIKSAIESGEVESEWKRRTF